MHCYYYIFFALHLFHADEQFIFSLTTNDAFIVHFSHGTYFASYCSHKRSRIPTRKYKKAEKKTTMSVNLSREERRNCQQETGPRKTRHSQRFNVTTTMGKAGKRRIIKASLRQTRNKQILLSAHALPLRVLFSVPVLSRDKCLETDYFMQKTRKQAVRH